MAKTVLPDFPVAGGCACGAVRYDLLAAPFALFACHCADCQTLTGSAFSLAMPIAPDALTITKGALKMWVRTAASGRQIPQYVCGDCGTRIYTAPPGPVASLTLRPGTLDDTGWLRPAAAFWRSSAQPYARFDDDMLVFDTQPDDFMPVVRAWRANLADASSSKG
jgi:hypothetical protein